MCLRIITSYVLLGPSDFVQVENDTYVFSRLNVILSQTYFDILLPHFVSLLRNVKDEGIVVLMQVPGTILYWYII